MTELARYDDAVRFLDEAGRLDPSYHWARKERGKALYLRGDTEAALDVFTKLAEGSAGFESQGLAGQVLALRKLGKTCSGKIRARPTGLGIATTNRLMISTQSMCR